MLRSRNPKNEIGHNFRVWHNLRKFFIQEINQNESLFPVKEYLTTPPEQNDDSEIFYNYLRTTKTIILFIIK